MMRDLATGPPIERDATGVRGNRVVDALSQHVSGGMGRMLEIADKR